MENTLQIGERYEVLNATANKNFGSLMYLGENLTSQQVRFAEPGGKVIFATLEGAVQPDLANPRLRFKGQPEQVFVSKVSEIELKRTEDLHKLKLEVYAANTEYRLAKVEVIQ